METRSGKQTWHQLTCGAVVTAGADAKATAHVKAEHKGAQESRAVAYGMTSVNDRHPVRERTSGSAAVNVR
ncbi:hypothetical protein ACIQ9Q_33695 [Streptomyces sp. NPDC094438]|uniref:hypothetical protein n=1 Tax=Streptomyces sp. NPDC094438 TaxID=3366061 RepID=UPI0038055200